LLELATALLDDLEQARVREATLRSYYLSLLTAARATVAAHEAGHGAPFTFLEHELSRRGQMPSGAEVDRILADARTAQTLIPHVDESRRSAPAGRVIRCAGLSRAPKRA
jgi:hypothetical protein